MDERSNVLFFKYEGDVIDLLLIEVEVIFKRIG